ncbi:clarin-3 [Anas platyrhynchos]|uniref:Clarin 3 n=2 Tax=Anas platyrhynchos TaxID=8839 RepID=A0A493TT52_ANAPP|nr:clarin-3 [Anas platyrhynchos]
MPTREKKLMFGAAFLTSVLSFVIICVVLGTQRWISSTIYFSQSNSSTSVTIIYGLFSGTCASKIDAGVQFSGGSFQVAELVNSSRKGINVTIIVLLVLSLLSSLLSSGFTFTNAVSNPYQTFLGPIGVYTWNAIGGFFTLIVMILFAVNVQGNNLSVELATKCASIQQNHTGSKHNYDYSYWILLLHILFSCATIVIIIFYSCARYTKKKEQERPIENASKDVILF